MSEYTKNLEVIRVVEASQKEAFAAFKAHTWLKCGGFPFSMFCYIAENGDPNTSVGQERVVGLIVHERILSIVENESIDYAVCKNFPCKNHHGRITFTSSPENLNETIITWHVDYTPYACCNWIVFAFVKMFFPIFLYNLKGEIRRRKRNQELNIHA